MEKRELDGPLRESLTGPDWPLSAGVEVIRLSSEELRRLKQWAQTTPEEQATKLEEFLQQPERQAEIGQALGRAMEPILKPMLDQIEAAALQGFDEETAAQIFEQVWELLKTRVGRIEERLTRLEAELFRRRT